ncbi:unnamed protein product [Adineta ricciae]|uniref:Adenylosuccinate synthetase n=1 Tax=Adineta ricciae TaxID=249248 RepID=A0A815CXR1_ADIRI|nr:unnamed protein product [Adineta ricciae]
MTSHSSAIHRRNSAAVHPFPNPSTVVIVLGAQWGDEGKGKLVDLLASEADIVCRCQGGNNAGHSVVVDGVEYDFHMLPSGFHLQNCVNIIGNGCVVNLPELVEEIKKNESRGVTDWSQRLFISDRAHLVFDFHKQTDGLIERGRGTSSLGTTKKGIGPTYSSKATRNGIRMIDLMGDFPIFAEKLRNLFNYYKLTFPDLEGDIEKTIEQFKALADYFRPMTIDTIAYLNQAIIDGSKKILVEGANATMLDIDFGTYPYVTSSNCSVGGACTGLGLPPKHIGDIYGVVKAYTTRVGDGVFPTELKNEIGEHLQTRGREWGVTTGRKRRCGWLDLVLLKYTNMINGFTALCLTKLDTLDELAEIKVATTYKRNGVELTSFPASVDTMHDIDVEYVTFPGWRGRSTSECRTFNSLPHNARLYVQFIEQYLGVPVKWIGVGKDRMAMLKLNRNDILSTECKKRIMFIMRINIQTILLDGCQHENNHFIIMFFQFLNLNINNQVIPITPSLSPCSSSPSLADSDFIHQRHVHPSATALDTVEHRRASIASVVHPDPLGPVAPNDEVTLKRHLGLFSGVCFIIGIIIGSGIFVSPKGVLRETQSVGLCLVIWMACGSVSLLGALCYAEIGTVIPRNGAEVAYMKEGIGSLHERTGDILGYLFSWTNTLILKPTSIAVLSLTFSQYFLSGIMDDCGPPQELVKMTAVFALLMLINVNSLSVSAANRLNILFVICKISTIVTVIIAGLVRIGQGHTQNLQNGFAGTTSKPFGVALAFYSGLWAYDGWNSLNSVTEELKNPKRNLWLSIVLALPFVMILYLLTNISYFTVMSKGALLSSNAVAVVYMGALGSANGSLFGAARYCMVSSQYGYLPEVFACIHSRRLTPVPGVVLQGFFAIAFCLPSNIDSLIDFFSFAAWIFYGLTFTATLCCKFTKKNANRVISVPLPLNVIIILISIYLVVAPLIAAPSIGFLVAGALILFGLVFYYPFVYRKIELTIITKLNVFLITFFGLKRAQVKI